jgi:hypothetical protein
MTSMPQMKAINDALADGWKPLDVWSNTTPEKLPVGGPVLMTNGYGMIYQIKSDGSITPMIPQDEISENAPHPMFGDSPRNGVIGYMCKIDFECELGGTSAVVRPNASQALCAGSCGVVEVEVIGRRIIVDERHDIGYVGADEALSTAWTETVRVALKEFDETDRRGLPILPGI